MKYICLKSIFLFSLLLATSTKIYAVEGLVLGFDFTVGGDKVAEFSNDTSQRAGDGIGFHIGYEFLVNEENFVFIQTTIGYSFDDPNIENGKSDITRTPVHLLVLKNVESHQFGAGLAYHKDPEIAQRTDGVGSATIDFDDALGYVLQYGYQFSDAFTLGGRYVDLEYESDLDPLDASNIGVFFTWNIE